MAGVGEFVQIVGHKRNKEKKKKEKYIANMNRRKKKKKKRKDSTGIKLIHFHLQHSKVTTTATGRPLVNLNEGKLLTYVR